MKKFILIAILFISAVASAAPKKEAAAKPDGASYDAELTKYPYPFTVSFLEIKTQKQKLKMAYMDVQAKQPANGKTVVLLHGKNFAGYYWEPTINLLIEKGYRVVVPDQIGFGKSAKPDEYQFSFQALAENTEFLLEQLNVKKAIIVGHSMGGMLAVRYALMYPKVTSQLVLVNPIGLEDWKTKVPYRGIEAGYKAELNATPNSIREYQKRAYYAGEWKPEYEALIQAQAGWTRNSEYSRVAWNAALTSDMIYTQPVVYELPLIKVPTLLIIGQRDRTAPGKENASPEAAATLGDYPKLGKAAAAAIPNAKLVEISGAGHVPQVEKFDAYKDALLEFIK